MYNDHLQSHGGKQRETGSPHIHDPAGLRFVIDGQHNMTNERQNSRNGQNLVISGNHNSINEHHASINGCNDRHIPYKMNNSVMKSQTNVSKTIQSELTNGTTNNNSPAKTPDRPALKQGVHPIKIHENDINRKNGINRLADANGRSREKQQLQKDTFNIAANLRQLLRPTVIEKRQERAKAEYDAEEINGPYNFRQLLRPTEYLPTESLRKRKGGLVSNGVPLPKDKVPEKHVKRRAPLAPTPNKLVNGKK